nr:XVIPCD domain-containing protein [Dyella sp. ASV24]
MTDFTRELEIVRHAHSLDEIQAVVRRFPAAAAGEGGILYSGPVGKVPSEVIAKELAAKTGLPLINDTPRARFLVQAEAPIKESAKRIFGNQGQSPALAKQSAANFLYGDAKAAAHSPTSLDGCLWGEASHDFAASLKGDIKVVATAANPERVFGKVEVPATLTNPKITSLAGQPMTQVNALYAKEGIHGVLPAVQAEFTAASAHGIYTLPNHPGGTITQVVVSKEAATALHLDATPFSSARYLLQADFVPAPIHPSAVTPSVASTPPLSAVRPASAMSLDAATVAREGGRVLGVAAIAIDATQTTNHAVDLLNRNNLIGAQSQVMHFGGRTVGMLAGAEMGVAAGAAMGVETGPGALATGLVGGVVGAIGGDALVTAVDNRRIYSQADKDGNAWHLDPAHQERGWTRFVSTSTSDPDAIHAGGVAAPAKQLTASASLSDELNYKATNVAVSLALARAPTPQDPYAQPAAAGDTASVKDAPWMRDPNTHQWSRHVTDRILEHGLTSAHTEFATPQRAAQLEQAAQQTIQDNLAHTPQAIAEHYQTAYAQYGRQRHGPMPEAVTTALHAPAHALQASDGHTYTRDTHGQWQTPGMVYGTNTANERVRAELDAADRVTMPTQSVNATAKPYVEPAVSSRAPVRLDDVAHPDHAMFKQAQTHVHALDATHGRTPDQRSDNLAAAVTVAAKAEGLKRIDAVVLSDDGSKAFAAQHTIPRAWTQTASVPTVQGLDTSIAQSTQAMAQVNTKLEQHAQQQAQMQSQAQNQQAQQGPSMGR